MTFDPYADEAAALQVGGLSVENRLDRVSLHGSLDLTRDRAGLRRARDLLRLLQAVVARLEGEEDALPEAVRTGERTDEVPNPFGQGGPPQGGNSPGQDRIRRHRGRGSRP